MCIGVSPFGVRPLYTLLFTALYCLKPCCPGEEKIMTLEINNVIVGGNLTKDIIVKDTVTGRKVCSFVLANNRTYQGNNGKVRETSFIDIEVWGTIAENCGKYLRKGSPVVIAGRLKQSRWETPDGDKRSRLKIVAQNVQFLSSASRTRSDSEPDVSAEIPENH